MSISRCMIEGQIPIHGSLLSMAVAASNSHDTHEMEAECGANN